MLKCCFGVLGSQMLTGFRVASPTAVQGTFGQTPMDHCLRSGWDSFRPFLSDPLKCMVDTGPYHHQSRPNRRARLGLKKTEALHGLRGVQRATPVETLYFWVRGTSFVAQWLNSSLLHWLDWKNAFVLTQRQLMEDSIIIPILQFKLYVVSNLILWLFYVDWNSLVIWYISI